MTDAPDSVTLPEGVYDFADGEAVLIPVEPGQKGVFKERTPENLYAPDDPELAKFLRGGCGLALTMRGDRAAIDADDPDALRSALQKLPDTVWQRSGSRTSEHHLYRVPGLNVDVPLSDPETGAEVGHVKAAPQSIIIGPGSLHPSGNRYGPLHGETVATVDRESLADALAPFTDKRGDARLRGEGPPREAHSTDVGRKGEYAYPPDGDGSGLSVYDVLSRASYPEGGRVGHPYHGSETNSNFMVDKDGETWRCWRHDCTGNALHLVGMEARIIECGDWVPGRLDTDTWREIFEAARDAGYPVSDPLKPAAGTAIADGSGGAAGGAVTPIAPPEPVVTDKGLSVAILTGDLDTVEIVRLGSWMCCQCGATTTVRDGTLSKPKECNACEANGPFDHAGGLSDSHIAAALRADVMWHPPTGVSDDDPPGLWDDVLAYLSDHWDAGGGDEAPAVYAGLTAYALSTWVRENLTFVPHLMLMAKTTGGKTRLLNTLARVSYRAVVSASATPASMFRLIDGYGVSFFVSEYHGLGQESRQELDNVVRAGQKRGEVITRAEQTAGGSYEPQVFDPFAHVAIATQYEPADDIVNRCIRVRSSPPKRDMPAVHDEARGYALRDRLLHARLRLLGSEKWDKAEAAAYDYLADRGIVGRTREKLLGLLTVAIVWDRLDDEFEAFVNEVVQQDCQAAADTDDALIVEAIRDLALEAVVDTGAAGDADPFGAVEIPYSDIANRFESMTGMEKSPTWVGHVRSRLGFEKARRRDGTVITDPNLGPKLKQLCDEHGLGWEPLDAHREVAPLDDDESYRAACSECGQLTRLTHRHVDGNHLCANCANGYEEVFA